MNALSYHRTQENGLSFELLVDWQPLGALIGSQNHALPYWLLENDLPHWPPYGSHPDPEIRIVTVCSCGEHDCGHTQCRVIHADEQVIFRDFDFDASPEGRKQAFRFTRANYEAVVTEIARLAREFAERERQHREQRPRRRRPTKGDDS
jgi:hypothetical protein